MFKNFFGFLTRRRTVPTHRCMYYKMNHRRRGLALIFIHEFFNISYLKPFNRTDVDRDNLKETFEKLGFEVKIYDDYSHDKMQKELQKAAAMNHANHDCIVICVLTHGCHGRLFAYDTDYATESVWQYFTPDKCPSLAEKPKIFVIQACQGEKVDPGLIIEKRDIDNIETLETDELSLIPAPRQTLRIPVCADFFIAFSSCPGFCSYRNPEIGAFFIHALCKELNKNGVKYDLSTILTLVCRRVAFEYEAHIPDMNIYHGKQMPYVITTLTRLIKFA